tara:strand:+ start:445 stop:720 length:276 start_codon:yes stop_codon:yes gene_type:complete
MTYNFDRTYEQRHNRYAQLAAKQVTPSEGKYCVITTRDAYYGDFSDGFSNDRHYFTNKRTAVAYAQHYSDICDHVAGVFKMPEFIEGVSCR